MEQGINRRSVTKTLPLCGLAVISGRAFAATVPSPFAIDTLTNCDPTTDFRKIFAAGFVSGKDWNQWRPDTRPQRSFERLAKTVVGRCTTLTETGTKDRADQPLTGSPDLWY
jgi:hypothetical protein